MSTQVLRVTTASGKSALQRVKSIFTSPGMAFSMLPILFSLTLLGIDAGKRTYGPSHWFVTYEHGFLRRALIGHLFIHAGYMSLHKIALIKAAVFFVVAALTIYAFRSILFGTFSERRFAAFLLAAPAFLPHMAYMNGEMDNFLYIAILLAAVGLMRFQNGFGMLWVTACSIVGLLMHEAFALMFYPLVLVLGIDLVHRGRMRLGSLVANVAIVAATFVAIIHFGKLQGTVDQWIAQSQSRTDMRIEATVFQVLGSNLHEQIRFVARMYTPKLILSLLVTLALAIPYGFALWRMLRTACEARGYSRAQMRWILLIFCAPLALPILGHDVMRWMSAFCINISLFLLFLYKSETRHNFSAISFCDRLTRWTEGTACTATMVYLLACGPWGYSGNLLLANLSHALLK